MVERRHRARLERQKMETVLFSIFCDVGVVVARRRRRLTVRRGIVGGRNRAQVHFPPPPRDGHHRGLHLLRELSVQRLDANRRSIRRRRVGVADEPRARPPPARHEVQRGKRVEAPARLPEPDHGHLTQDLGGQGRGPSVRRRREWTRQKLEIRIEIRRILLGGVFFGSVRARLRGRLARGRGGCARAEECVGFASLISLARSARGPRGRGQDTHAHARLLQLLAAGHAERRVERARAARGGSRLHRVASDRNVPRFSHGGFPKLLGRERRAMPGVAPKFRGDGFAASRFKGGADGLRANVALGQTPRGGRRGSRRAPRFGSGPAPKVARGLVRARGPVARLRARPRHF